jgi:hypothetical protein
MSCHQKKSEGQGCARCKYHNIFKCLEPARLISCKGPEISIERYPHNDLFICTILYINSFGSDNSVIPASYVIQCALFYNSTKLGLQFFSLHSASQPTQNLGFVVKGDVFPVG